MLRKVAVTGGLSCGKSSVCRIFEDLGCTVVSADEIVHQLLTPETKLGRDVVALLGADIILNGVIDRNLVAKKVFQDKNLLHNLESLIHPAVSEEIWKKYKRAETEGKAKAFVAEVPLLFEVGWEPFFDTTICVIADEAECIKRFTHQKQDGGKPGQNARDYWERASRQLSQTEKAKRAHFVINNSSSLEETRTQVANLAKQLQIIH